MAAGACSVDTGFKDGWVVTVDDIVLLTSILDDGTGLLVRFRRIPNARACCAIDGAMKRVDGMKDLERRDIYRALAI